MTPSTSYFPAPDDVGADNAEYPRPSLPMRMTFKSSASTFADANHSPYNEDLLTPPLTNPSLDESPFRPAESDRTSLSMKRRHCSSHQRRRRHNRACMSSGDVDQTALFRNESSGRMRSLSRSQSAPNLTKMLRAAFRRNNTRDRAKLRVASNSTQAAEWPSHSESPAKQPRRWTMPGKAAPTRVLTSMSPSAVIAEPVGHPSNNETAENDGAVTVETPAMITLQRASSRSRRTSLRPEAYTSFPTPKFSKTRSGFVTTFFGDGWQRPENTFIHASVESVSIASHIQSPPSRSDRASVDHGSVHPSNSSLAGPVCTGVVLDPVIQGRISEQQSASRARRCSTKYVSGASTYEIIWDENVSTSSSGESRRTSADQARRISLRDNEMNTGRRQSVAVDKLETQLFKGVEQSRNASLAFRGHDNTSKNSRPTHRSASRMSFHNLLNFQSSGCATEEESESHPRSRASTLGKKKPSSTDMEVHLTTMTGDDAPTGRTGFFPPVSGSRTALDASNDPLLINPWRTSWETRNMLDSDNSNKEEPDFISMPQHTESMIGRSTGERKKSVQKRRPWSERRVGGRKRKKSGVVEDDQAPLLGMFNSWQEHHPTGEYH